MAASEQAFKMDPTIQSAVEAVSAKLSATICPNDLGIAFGIVSEDRESVHCGGLHADQGFYPASVVKLFYAVYALERLRIGLDTLTAEYERAITDMIRDSSNDATALVLDTVTETTGGPELPALELKLWMQKRQEVNDFFRARGYHHLNCCQKTWNEGPYGREKQGYGPHMELRNMLTPSVSIQLMAEIARKKAFPPGIQNGKDWNEFLKEMLFRTVPAENEFADEQSAKFSGQALPAGSVLYSKAGWTSEVRHDLAWVVLPSGTEIIYAIFTKGHSEEDMLIGNILSRILLKLGLVNSI